MILLDTNVVSEWLRLVPEVQVMRWINSRPTTKLYLCSITVAELRFGVALLPMGRRRNGLHEYLENSVLPRFSGRVLPFDMDCASSYAELRANARKVGISIRTADACIAAVALTNRFTVATRDVNPFRAAGLTVINPWEEE
jgi:predicted nucleic acid-binding protein